MCLRSRTRAPSTTCFSEPVPQSALEMAANPERLGAEIGMIGILHTWGQNLLLHPHIHCVIPAGGLSPDHQHWVSSRHRFFLPVKVLKTRLSRQVHRRTETSASAQEARLHRTRRRIQRTASSSLNFWAGCVARTGSSTPSPLLEDLCRCCAILAATLTVLPSRIIACWLSMESASPSAGAIMRTAISHAS